MKRILWDTPIIKPLIWFFYFDTIKCSRYTLTTRRNRMEILTDRVKPIVVIRERGVDADLCEEVCRGARDFVQAVPALRGNITVQNRSVKNVGEESKGCFELIDELVDTAASQSFDPTRKDRLSTTALDFGLRSLEHNIQGSPYVISIVNRTFYNPIESDNYCPWVVRRGVGCVISLNAINAFKIENRMFVGRALPVFLMGSRVFLELGEGFRLCSDSDCSLKRLNPSQAWTAEFWSIARTLDGKTSEDPLFCKECGAGIDRYFGSP